MQCNQCGSTHTQRLQMTYEGGTQLISTRSHTGDMLDLSDSLRLTGHVTTTSGVSSSVLAQRAAPPVKRKLTTMLIVTLVGFGLFRGSEDYNTIGFLMMLFGAYKVFDAIRFNSRRWPALYQHWQDSWLCHKCGHVYQQA